jgi:peptidoglycan hydrolase-like protein with peptidoglycan-binding domain
MECSNLLEAALSKGDISKSLFQGSPNKELITDLQRVLFELGFKSELKFDNYQADGVYSPATVSAVSAFALKNNYKSDGTSVSNQLAKLIRQRHSFLPEMYLLWSISNSDLRTKKYISKGTRVSITAIQILLNERGYGKLLNFPKYGADGSYGQGTRNAVIAYAKDNAIQSDGDLLTRPLIDLMIKDINAFYGKNWSDLAINNLPGDESPLVLFEGSRFQGQPCRADVKFVPMLKKINAYAEQAEVFVHVTSSFRTSSNVKGAIVKPATRSNHMAGHAIDMNVIYDNNKKSANSQELGKYPAVAEPVRRFIKFIIDDPNLRWGGQFKEKDPVHIDDKLNQDTPSWDKRYLAMQKAVQLGNV